MANIGERMFDFLVDSSHEASLAKGLMAGVGATIFVIEVHRIGLLREKRSSFKEAPDTFKRISGQINRSRVIGAAGAILASPAVYEGITVLCDRTEEFFAHIRMDAFIDLGPR